MASLKLRVSHSPVFKSTSLEELQYQTQSCMVETYKNTHSSSCSYFGHHRDAAVVHVHPRGAWRTAVVVPLQESDLLLLCIGWSRGFDVEEKVPTVFNGSLSRNLLSNNGSVSYSLGVDVMATKFFLLRCCTNCNGSCDNVQCNGLFFFCAAKEEPHHRREMYSSWRCADDGKSIRQRRWEPCPATTPCNARVWPRIDQGGKEPGSRILGLLETLCRLV
jgi:hypothetical protein